MLCLGDAFATILSFGPLTFGPRPLSIVVSELSWVLRNVACQMREGIVAHVEPKT